jgi:hypothetical protein
MFRNLELFYIYNATREDSLRNMGNTISQNSADKTLLSFSFNVIIVRSNYTFGFFVLISEITTLKTIIVKMIKSEK